MNEDLPETTKSEPLKRLADPEWKEEYEMPEWYQERLQQFVELLESRDEYKKILPTLAPADYAQALPAFKELNEAVETLEQKLADEYENYQEEQRREQEVYELTYLQENISEELFIWVKHNKPYIFEEFAKYATSAMTAEELEEHDAIIARREAAELDVILSSKKPPAVEFKSLFLKMLLPDEWMPEQFLHIIHQAYKTDNFFKDNLEVWERGIDIKRGFTFGMGDALPVRRRNLEDAAVDLKKQLDAGGRFLLDYFEENRKSGKFVLRENPNVAKLDELFERLEGNRERKYVVLKLTQPEKLDEYVRIVTEDFTPAETEAFLTAAAESEKKDRRALTDSLEKERQSIEMVEARRAAGEKKIAGPELKDFKRREIREKQYLKPLEPQADGKTTAYDAEKRLDRNLRAFYAITKDDFTSERYEDDQSREEEQMEASLDSMMRNIEQLFIVIKNESPDKFAEFEQIVTQDMLPEELEEFYARIAQIEAETEKPQS